MRNMNFKRFYKVALFLAILVIFISSCSKKDKMENQVHPDYVGAWMSTDTIYIPNYGTTSIKDVMTLTETNFSDLRQVQVLTVWMDFISMKGTLSVDGNLINVKITEAGTSLNMATKIPSGKITTYKEGTPEFDSLLSLAKLSKAFKSEYSVSGNKLTLKTDANNNGTYDAGEITVYTKQ